MQFFRRVWALLHWQRQRAELREEMAFHRDALERDRERNAGVQNATVEARRVFGSAALANEESVDVWVPRPLRGLGQDLVYGLRTLRATPVATCAAVLSLALGIGANTAIFSIVNSLVLRPLPIRAPSQLVVVTDDDASRARPWTYAVWKAFRDDPAIFQGMAAWSFSQRNAGSASEPQMIDGLWVSGSFFSTLGVQPFLGRGLSDADDRVDGGADGPVAVISFAWWQARFGGAADVIGQRISLDGVPFTIVGVAPADFLGPEVGRSFAVAMPLGDEPLVHQHNSALTGIGTQFLTVVGRLHDGQTLAAANAALLATQPAIRDATRPAAGTTSPQSRITYLSKPFVLRPAATGTSSLRSSYREPLAIVQGIVVLILLIACVNITNLMLARASARRHELSVRAALGASAWRIARQLLIESSLLSALGTILGIGVARWTGQFLVVQFSFTGNHVVLDLRSDVAMWTFAAGVATITTVLFGTLPAIRASRTAPIEALRSRGAAGADRQGRQWMSCLLIGQVALSLTLVAAAALFVRSFALLTGKHLGFEPGGVMVVTVDTTRAAGAERLGLYERVLETTRTVSSVANAGASYLPPVGMGAYTPTIQVNGTDVEDVSANVITPGWFSTLKAQMVAGRDFTTADAPAAPRVAIVNQTFASRMFGGETPLGRQLTLYPHRLNEVGPLTIVGVVEDMAYRSVRLASPPTWFVPLAQFDIPQFPFTSMALLVRPRDGQHERFDAVVRAIADTSPKLTVSLRPLPDYIRATVTRDRVMALLGGFFGVLALLLASVGLYGVTSYLVSRQRAEFGIRLALGATPRRVFLGVAFDTLWRVAFGVGLGLAFSAYAWKFVASLLFGLEPHDPRTLITAAAAFLSVAAAATAIPAWRASRIDPAEVFRNE